MKCCLNKVSFEDSRPCFIVKQPLMMTADQQTDPRLSSEVVLKQTLQLHLSVYLHVRASLSASSSSVNLIYILTCKCAFSRGF